MSVAWSEITGKPSAYPTNMANISDLHSSWDSLLKAAPPAYVTRWPSWGEVTGKPSTFTPSSHTHSYLPLSGGTMTGGLTFNQDSSLSWSRNTDYFNISFKNTGDGDTDSYALFKTGDNGNEYFKWQQVNGSTTTDLMTLKGDALRFKNNVVLHAGNYNSYAPTKTGGGASGTWGIGVSGNAATATKLKTARKVNGTPFDGSADITTAKWGASRRLTLTGGVTGWASIDGSGDVTIETAAGDIVPGVLPFDGSTTVTPALTSLTAVTAVRFNASLGAFVGFNGNTNGGNWAACGTYPAATAYGTVTTHGATPKRGVVYLDMSAGKAMYWTGTVLAEAYGVSVAWSEITGKPSSYPTNIANISDLHSSWDSVLKAQKPSWLTGVSLATISDLHSSWDTLLKSAPPSFVYYDAGTNPDGLVINRSSASVTVTMKTGKGGDFDTVEFPIATKSLAGAMSASDKNNLNGYNWNLSGNQPYAKLATLKITGSYVNTPLTFQIKGRSGPAAFVSITFVNSSGTDPGISGFTGWGGYSGYYTRLRIYKTAASTWELWLKSQSQSYDSGFIWDVVVPSGMTFIFNGSPQSSLPTATTYSDCGAATLYGNLAWGSISGKPSAYPTNIANVLDLHSSWDSLLKSGPSSYVTRWPSWGEVTGKPSTFTPSSHTHSYLPLSGGTMTGQVKFTAKGTSYIGNGGNDAANGVGGALNNLVISSWNGVSFTTSCGGQAYTNTNAVTIDCRNGIAKAARFDGPLNGNASTATQLKSARRINGTAFNGTADITTAQWGGARNFYIQDASAAHTGTAVSVSGANHVYLKLPGTITAALSGNASSATKLQTARTLWGQSFNGTGNVAGNMTGVGSLTMSGTLTLQGTENNDITNVKNGNGAITVNRPNGNAAIRNALVFKWYGTNWQIGNVRGSSSGTDGFGFTLGSNKLVFRITESTAYMYGKLQCTSLTQTSDLRLKAVKGDVGLLLDQVASAPSVRFSWKDGGGRGVGSTAQYWKGVLPEAVSGDGGTLSMDYGVVALLSAITAARSLKGLERRVADLEKRVGN